MSRSDSSETPLTAWLRAVLWGAFLVPTIGFAAAAWWGFDRAEQEAKQSVSHARDLAYQHARRSFDIAAEIATLADAATAQGDAAVLSQEEAIHQRLSDLTAGLPSIVNLNIWDANGRAMARSDVYPVDKSADVSDRAYFQEQRDGLKGIGVSEVIKGRQSGIELMNTTLRRRSPDGSFRGIVAVSLSPKFFREYYESLANEEPGVASFALVRTDGAVIARWPNDPSFPARVPHGLVQKRIREDETEGHASLPATANSEARLASFRKLEAYPLYVVAGLNRQAMFASWARFVALLAAVVVPTTAGLVYVSWVALRKTRRERDTALELQEQVRRRANAERTMLESQKLETLAVVTAGVAHDFNNLLAVISASLHVHQRRHPQLAGDRQLQAMGRAVQSGARLTRQLLSFSQKQALRPETVSLQAWLPIVEGLVRSTLPATVTWSLHVDPDTRPLKVDLGELELALINLVVNARHAMPSGGYLEVKACNAGIDKDSGAAMVALSVRDTGVGIPPELMQKVLEPFFTTRDKGVGSGLGLSQVQGFCTQAGGFVHIESEVGAGTTVAMCLPATDEVLAEPVQSLPTTGGGNAVTTKLEGRILLVEDNEDVATATEMVLHGAGLVVERVSDADKALAVLVAGHPLPDAVFSDIAMPGAMNGIELATKIRARWPQLPILLTTGYAEQSADAVAAGFKVLFKPVDAQGLIDELRDVLMDQLDDTESHAVADSRDGQSVRKATLDGL